MDRTVGFARIWSIDSLARQEGIRFAARGKLQFVPAFHGSDPAEQCRERIPE